jgi:hypothetical protein
MDSPAGRLTRLLIAGFYYKEALGDHICLAHARRRNGHVVFHRDGAITSVENLEFARIEVGEVQRFNDFMHSIKPASRWQRLLFRVKPIGLTLIVLGALSLAVMVARSF